MSQPKILVFIPSYNCEKQLPRVLAQFDDELSSFISEVLVINNISPDNTEKAAIDYLKSHQDKLKTRFKVVRNNENYGLGGSQKVAFNYAIEHDFDYVMILHGDDQGSIRDFLPILKDLSQPREKLDCYLGGRFHPKSSLQGYSAFRSFGNLVFNSLYALICRQKVYDLGAGINLYKVSALRDHFYLKMPDALTFNYVMLIAHAKLGHKYKFFPITWREDDQVSNVKLFSQARKLIWMTFAGIFFGEKFYQQEHREKIIDQYGFSVQFDTSRD